ncbi:MAG: histidinol-phosphate transaminase [Pseudonocardiales bacterium]|nr:histidinol-phosphate transaminase [Pseudonocardiales bacterium]MBV9029766.1 histidinol-phosphate transaminase [Pseudonocardiales bacterium]
MTARTRADLDSLAGYVPGRSIPGAVRLASNEVPAGPLPSVIAAISVAAAGVNRYPDDQATALVDRLALRWDVPPTQLAVGCGSSMLCQQLVQATCGPADEVLFAWRSFELYPIITQVAGARLRTVPLRADHSHDLAAMLGAITPATRLVFVCNPNNPTGTVVRGEELVAFLDAVPDGVLVVLDEAYHEFVTDPAVGDGMALYRRRGRDRDNLAVLRTFSKAYGLAGLRVGYCAAPEPVAAALGKVSVPFSVNSLAQVAALASLDVEDELLARCRGVVAERARVRAELLALGYPVPDSQANFVWLPLGEQTATFTEHCLAHKIVIRPFPGDGARVTISDPSENDTFLAAAREWRCE